MATALQRKPSHKHETFVEQQLTRTRKRIRALDVGSSLLGFLVVTLAYALIMAMLDRWLELPTALRLAPFFAYLFAAGYFLCQTGIRLYRRVNPLFAARCLEETLPHAKNSLVNWLDLQEVKLAPAIRGALGQQAANDLRHTNAEQAVSAKQTWWLMAALALLFLGLLILFVAGPAQFGSLLSRAFSPFRDIALATRTTITLLQPAGGDVTVGINQGVEFRARIEGRFPSINQPGAPGLHLRYHQQDPFASLALVEDVDGNWATSLHPDQVQNGFWYKITAGDAETPEYQVRVRSQPQATRFQITYRCRPYLQVPEHTVAFPNGQAVFPRIRAPRGTEVTLAAWANVALGQARLRLENAQGKKDKELIGEIVPQAKDAVRFKFVLEGDGFFKLLFTSKEGEENSDRSPYPIEVLPDNTPRVVLTQPGQDVQLPTNGTLPLEGLATDDFGIKNLTLRLKVIQGASRPELAPKPFRPDKPFRFDDGTYPDRLEYKDFLALDKIHTAEAKAFPLAPGMVLEYWLEAVDNCDYPDKNGNLGKSLAYKITILEPEKDLKKQRDDRQKLQEQQQQHQKKQDQEHARQNDQKNKEKEAQGQANKQKQDGTGQQQEKELQQKQDELNKTADRLKKEIDKQEKENKDKGEAKGADGPKGEAKKSDQEPKDNESGQAKGSKAEKEQQTGQKKEGNQKQPAGQAKDQGAKQEKQAAEKPGEAKQGSQNKEAGPKDQAAKDSPQKGQPKPSDGTAKQQPKEQPQDQGQPGTAKNEGQKEKGQPGQAKDAGKDQTAKQEPKGERKEAGKDQPPGQAKTSKATPEASSKNQGQAGDPKQKQPNSPAQAKDQGKTEAKEGPGQAKNNEPSPGQGQDQKPGQAKAEEAKGEAKNAAKKQEGGPKDSEGAGKQAAPRAESKPGPGKSDHQPGLARDDQGQPQGQAQDSAQKNNPTQEDVARLQKELQGKDRKAREQARQELKRIEREAKDPPVQQAAREALKQAEGDPKQPMEKVDPNTPLTKDGPGKEKGTPGSEGVGKDKTPGQEVAGKDTDPKKGTAENQKGKGENPLAKGDPQKGEPGKGPAQSQPGGTEEGKGQAQKGGKEPGQSGPGGQGASDDPKAQAPDASAARRGGDLSLEELKKKITPDILKKAGLTERDWQQFLKNYQAYEDMRQKLARQAGPKDTQRGDPSLLPGSGLRKVSQTPNAKTDPLQTGTAQPPPEFREYHRLFTSSPSGARPSPDKK